MRKHIFYAVLSAMSLITAVSCHRQCLDLDTAPENYYLLTLENQSNTDVVWFIPYHSDTDGVTEDGLPASLSGMGSCSFVTKAHERISVNVSEDKSGPFESYAKDALVPFYVFDESVFEDEDWTAVLNGKKWLAKYTLSAEDVIDRGKKIVYRM